MCEADMSPDAKESLILYCWLSCPHDMDHPCETVAGFLSRQQAAGRQTSLALGHNHIVIYLGQHPWGEENKLSWVFCFLKQGWRTFMEYFKLNCIPTRA